MARFGLEPGERGHLEVRDGSDGSRQGYFVPRPPGGDDGEAMTSRREVKILEVTASRDELRIFPIDTRPWDAKFLKPKYSKIRTITLEDQYIDDVDLVDLLETELPSGFTKDPQYGLGLAREFEIIIDHIEKHTSCDTLVLTGGSRAEVDDSEFRMGYRFFDNLRRELTRIKGRGDDAILRVKRASVHNALAEALGLETTHYSLGRHETSRWLTEVAAGNEPLAEDERDALLSETTKRAAEMASQSPQQMVRLQREIQLVNLDQLIGAYEQGLKATHVESWWQNFFEQNVFVLQLLFGGPTVFIDSQVPIGEGGNSTKGKKIADYLFTNPTTHNAALVEIKRPNTRLINAQAYRAGVYGIHSEVSKSVTQVLDQALQLTRHEADTRERTRHTSWASSAPRCFVVAGHTDELDSLSKKKSFELFREHLSGARLVTYDELLEQLKLLRNFLATERDTTVP